MRCLPVIAEKIEWSSSSDWAWHWHWHNNAALQASKAWGDLGYVFNCQLRKADGFDLGLVVSHCESDGSMLVEGVLPNGVIQSWNNLCVVSLVRSGLPDRFFRAGDKIMSVNGIWKSVPDMVRECNSAMLLQFCVVRGVGHPLRPCAGPFVPGRSSHDISSVRHCVLCLSKELGLAEPVEGARDMHVL